MRHTVLIADDDADLVELLTIRCKALGLEVDTAGNAMTALGKIEEFQPCAVILDVNMPSGSGLSVAEMMANHEQLRLIPVILLTGSTSEQTVRRCHELCIYYVLKAPDVWSRIEPVLSEVLQLDTKEEDPMPLEKVALDSTCETGATDLLDNMFAILGVEQGNSLMDNEAEQTEMRDDQPWVLSVEDDEDVALALKLRLQELGLRVIRATAGTEGYRRAFVDSPRAILLDYELPQGNGDYVLRRLKESPATRDIPVIVITGRKESHIERQMLNLGASEFLTKPIDWSRLREALMLRLDSPIEHSDRTNHSPHSEQELAAVGTLVEDMQ